MTDPDALLEDLNDAQREAVLATSGPVVILAGAGTGKTRVISRRAAYAIATGVVPASDVLVVTFTDKAAGEMATRLASLGQPGVTARTFHAHALSQLGYFWPGRHDGAPMPEILSSKIPIVGRLARSLPGGYRFTAAKDLADEIEWAKSRRISPATYLSDLPADGSRTPPIPAELFARLYADYERAKQRAGRIDFDDMLIGTVELLETDEAARAVVQARKRWISVDEYQDTNPLQERLLELWLGDRTDLCVVGDPDQTIYTFTGATSGFLTGFAACHPATRVVALTENYRSTPQVLDFANRAIGRAGSSELRATRAAGPPPSIRAFRDGH
ncbi:MAG: ATP-dependent helicase UvrD/PcrA, partial [Chloroflexota bacterium]|nr:ATP-dependent helicase UvrD/PcrA [Chloroflexota bacterium]